MAEARSERQQLQAAARRRGGASGRLTFGPCTGLLQLQISLRISKSDQERRVWLLAGDPPLLTPLGVRRVPREPARLWLGVRAAAAAALTTATHEQPRRRPHRPSRDGRCAEITGRLFSRKPRESFLCDSRSGRAASLVLRCRTGGSLMHACQVRATAQRPGPPARPADDDPGPPAPTHPPSPPSLPLAPPSRQRAREPSR
jgi:hypothetical protein